MSPILITIQFKKITLRQFQFNRIRTRATLLSPPVIFPHAARLEGQEDNNHNEEDDIEEAEQLLLEHCGAELHQLLTLLFHGLLALNLLHGLLQVGDVGWGGHQPLDT